MTDTSNPSSPAPPTHEMDEGRRVAELTQLLDDLRSGQLDALEQIWELCARDLHALALWRTGSTADAEDALQNVFTRLARSAGRLGEVRQPLKYLLSMAHHAAIDALRDRRPDISLDEATVVYCQTDTDRSAEAAWTSRHVANLPAAQREVLYLKHFSGLTFRDIASVTGVSTFTAASRYRLALRRLRQLMGITS